MSKGLKQLQYQILLERAETKSHSNSYQESPLSHPPYTVTVSYCSLYVDPVPGDCYICIIDEKTKIDLYTFIVQQ
jgi:hypothetical protein